MVVLQFYCYILKNDFNMLLMLINIEFKETNRFSCSLIMLVPIVVVILNSNFNELHELFKKPFKKKNVYIFAHKPIKYINLINRAEYSVFYNYKNWPFQNKLVSCFYGQLFNSKLNLMLILLFEMIFFGKTSNW